jgi:hypothetical protein
LAWIKTLQKHRKGALPMEEREREERKAGGGAERKEQEMGGGGQKLTVLGCMA